MAGEGGGGWGRGRGGAHCLLGPWLSLSHSPASTTPLPCTPHLHPLQLAAMEKDYEEIAADSGEGEGEGEGEAEA